MSILTRINNYFTPKRMAFIGAGFAIFLLASAWARHDLFTEAIGIVWFILAMMNAYVWGETNHLEGWQMTIDRWQVTIDALQRSNDLNKVLMEELKKRDA